MQTIQSALRKPLLISSFFLLILSCDEHADTKEIVPIDHDMIAAVKMANDYLISSNGRSSTAEEPVTVLKLIDGTLVFQTSTNNSAVYAKVTEQTLTASVAPGSHVFWYAGEGLADLVGIEFDEESQAQLTEVPTEIETDKMWMLTIAMGETEDELEEDDELKYDILYVPENGNGSYIRLDPKIKINH